jgi:hypothetical protein
MKFRSELPQAYLWDGSFAGLLFLRPPGFLRFRLHLFGLPFGEPTLPKLGLAFKIAVFSKSSAHDFINCL